MLCVELDTDSQGRNDADFNLCDFTEGVICAPRSEEYRFCNSAAWRRADVGEWGKSPPQSILCPGHWGIDSDTVFKPPPSGGR